ncbi:hypothetical protein GGR56DRAFT_440205 [Xylariaceae sp. FL0804]|nr:hypothetical protein GGR56DRAFT_440205 [Xylariaceae sp. FL0804]
MCYNLSLCLIAVHIYLLLTSLYSYHLPVVRRTKVGNTNAVRAVSTRETTAVSHIPSRASRACACRRRESPLSRLGTPSRTTCRTHTDPYFCGIAAWICYCDRHGVVASHRNHLHSRRLQLFYNTLSGLLRTRRL